MYLFEFFSVYQKNLSKPTLEVYFNSGNTTSLTRSEWALWVPEDVSMKWFPFAVILLYRTGSMARMLSCITGRTSVVKWMKMDTACENSMRYITLWVERKMTTQWINVFKVYRNWNISVPFSFNALHLSTSFVTSRQRCLILRNVPGVQENCIFRRHLLHPGCKARRQV